MTEAQDQLTNAKLAIYLLMYSIIKINPSYFNQEVYRALNLQEKEIIKQLQGLD